MPDATATTTGRERAVFKVFIKGPIQAVWNEITKTDAVQQCFFNMRLYTPGLKPGAPFQMRTKDGKYVGVVGEVLECDPPHRYVTTFKFTKFDDPPCKISYDLKEVAGGTEFVMTFDDLPAGTTTAKQMVSGGNFIVNTLKSIVETGRPSFGVRLLYGVFAALQFLTPRRMLAENWPLDGEKSQPKDGE
jgi:uncharacterized protein YndB with AHSA1/START domain